MYGERIDLMLGSNWLQDSARSMGGSGVAGVVEMELGDANGSRKPLELRNSCRTASEPGGDREV